MRVCYILLMAAATLFANSNAASAVTTADQKKLTNVVSGDLVQSTNEQVGGNGKRFLRSHKVVDDDDDDESEADGDDDDDDDDIDANDEERKGPWLFSSDKIKKMMGDDNYLFAKFANWKKRKLHAA
ncbi:hypothetical protein BBJ29_008944 [Phytophthora kernoviae]|uniref:RxLR effector protein n=1 Tax=Phytophthora kernoviae TaxID=325452 RepID=A0A3R7GJC7_9STRA|nr:hypothetical protein BBJ29_008944 [Phytophthora kernoviae]